MKKMMGLMLVFVAGLTVGTRADYIVKPISAASSSIWGDPNIAANAISGAGLTADLITGAAVPSVWPEHGAEQSTYWISGEEAFGTGKWIEFDLGKTYVVSSFHVWNYSNPAAADRGAKDMVVQYKDSSEIGSRPAASCWLRGPSIGGVISPGWITPCPPRSRPETFAS